MFDNHKTTYIERLYLAIDNLSDMLDNIDGDFDIHNLIDDVSIRYDVEKRDLLDWYDNNSLSIYGWFLKESLNKRKFE